MKKFTSFLFISMMLILCLVTFNSNSSFAEYIHTYNYFPLTVEKLEQAIEHVRSEYYENEFPSDFWAGKFKAILVPEDPTMNNRDYLDATYGIHSLEDTTLILNFGWSTGLNVREDEEWYSIPDKIYSNKNIPLYFILNETTINTMASMAGDTALIGLLLHEFTHIYDYNPAVEFSKFIWVGENRKDLSYSTKEKIIDAYLFAAKDSKVVIPMYEMNRWIANFACGYFASVGLNLCVDDKIPSDNPFVDGYLTIAQTWDGNDIKRFFYRPIEYGLMFARMSDPTTEPCDVLDDDTLEVYNYLMIH